MGVTFLFVVVIAVASAAVLLFGRVARVGSAARVHVDDLAVGNVPAICAVTGVPTTHRVEVSSSEGGFQGWWLFLLFLGPVGFAGIIVLAALARRPGRVAGVVHVSPEALERYEAMVRLSRRSMAAFFGITVVGLIGLTTVGRATATDSRLLMGVAVFAGIALLVALASSIIAPYRWLDLRLDGSGRWVTITQVHADFARALGEQQARIHARS